MSQQVKLVRFALTKYVSDHIHINRSSLKVSQQLFARCGIDPGIAQIVYLLSLANLPYFFSSVIQILLLSELLS
ncbi:hypothetical protein SDC9_95726 [bioreactor metagenome]|uniref:Uncharacterized protein n=1 Tax=bioreactor metagenome TaxID=1076179 RepID=A0A645A749_9ZZZZ